MEIEPIPGFAHPLSSLLHLAGAGIFAFLSLWLLRRGRGEAGRVITLGVFCFAVIFMLSMSGVYHLLSAPSSAHRVLQRLDHAAIFVLIAGTFTPIHWVLFKGWWRWGMLALIWSIAITGLTLKSIFFDDIPEGVGLALYLSLGWLGVVSGVAIWRRWGFDFVKPLVWGGAAYTLGALLEFLGGPVLIPGVLGPHELLHIGVLAGIGFHWSFIYSMLPDNGSGGTSAS